MVDKRIYKLNNYTKNTNVVLKTALEEFLVCGSGRTVEHSRYADGSGSFNVSDLKVGYHIELKGLQQKREMHLNPEVLGLTLKKDEDKYELFSLCILPVARIIAERDGLEIIEPHWFKEVTESYEKKALRESESSTIRK